MVPAAVLVGVRALPRLPQGRRALREHVAKARVGVVHQRVNRHVSATVPAPDKNISVVMNASSGRYQGDLAIKRSALN